MVFYKPEEGGEWRDEEAHAGCGYGAPAGFVREFGYEEKERESEGGGGLDGCRGSDAEAEPEEVFSRWCVEEESDSGEQEDRNGEVALASLVDAVACVEEKERCGSVEGCEWAVSTGD